MKIAFVGASGYGNVGDETYPLVFKEFFRNDELLFLNSNLPTNLPSDLGLIVMGGGGILHNVGNQPETEESAHFKCMQFYMDWAIEKDIPWGFLSCGFQFRPQGEALYRECLKPWIPYLSKANFITLRSPRDVEIAADLTGRSDLRFVPDAGYLFTPVSRESRPDENLLVLVPAGLVNPRNRFTQHLIRLFASMDYEIAWLAMGSEKDDGPHLEEAQRLFPNARIESSRNPHRAFEIIANAKMVFTGRYHGMVFARKCRIPFLVPEAAPFKLVNENYEVPMGAAIENIEILRSFLNSA